MNQEAASGVDLPITLADGITDMRESQSPQASFDALTDEMMLYRPSRGVNYSPFRLPNLNPQDFLASLRDAVPEGLLIADGREMPKLLGDLTIRRVDSSRVSAVALVAHRFREHGGVRRFLVLEFSSSYPDGIRAMQKVQLESDSRLPGELRFHRVALVDPNLETAGYDRTPEVVATVEQAGAFIKKAKGLFEVWQKENPKRVARVPGVQESEPHSKTSRK